MGKTEKPWFLFPEIPYAQCRTCILQLTRKSHSQHTIPLQPPPQLQHSYSPGPHKQ
ncbi:hypothetical protein ASPFODRAFT_369322 [Aspergillus luchuensis CBS 106.47]|uniref:Uncharacterized protein n=1 Tax=Aspergillus luchuensis (strain CBS 106.47) TaxID=1137211 RepID=A0A1M3T5F2_ASPLC|nr:hypothetical protein ASPFODRAFT_369322 [Aspergillus luchuensis CBS 106.47]